MADKQENDSIPKGYTRVTAVLETFTNFDSILPHVLENATERGSVIHEFCEYHALSLFVDEPPENCKPYIESFKKWFDEMVLEIYSTELRINDGDYRVSGQFDLICRLKGDNPGQWTVIDFKSPQVKSKTWQIQTAAYMLLINKNLHIHVTRRMALMLDNEGKKAKCVEYTDHENDINLFLSALSLHKFFMKK